MIAKKNPKLDLEKKRFAFFQIGLILSGSMCLAAFEYSSGRVEALTYESVPDYGIIIDEPITDVIITQPAKPQLSRAVIDEIKIVEKLTVIETYAVDTSSKIIVIDTGDFNIGIGTPVVEDVDSTYTYVDVDPNFPGGLNELSRFIQNNLKLPNEIPDYDQGTIYVRFVVDRDGSIQEVEIARGLSRELDRAAINVVKSMPNWTPGEVMGRKVRSRFTLPIKISLS